MSGILQAVAAFKASGGGAVDMSYAIPFRALTGSNPADAATYYVGDGWAGVGITSGVGAQFIEALKLTVPVPGIVTAVEIAAIYVDGSPGSGEAVTYSLHLNGAAGSAGSSTALGTATWDTATYNTTRKLVTGLSLAVVASDLLLLKIITPTWVTNPTGVVINGLIYVQA